MAVCISSIHYSERNNTMFKLLLVVLALVVGYTILQQLPDIQRYLKIRAM